MRERGNTTLCVFQGQSNTDVLKKMGKKKLMAIHVYKPNYFPNTSQIFYAPETHDQRHPSWQQRWIGDLQSYEGVEWMGNMVRYAQRKGGK